MTTATAKPAGKLVLHPTHWLFRQLAHPQCTVCRKEILPMQPVIIEPHDDRMVMIYHDGCDQGERGA